MDTNVKHPASLRVFFATEMWERYGFYVVQSLLALYLASHYQWHDKHIYALVGSFTALTYLSPVIGGWIADHLLGQKNTVLSGAVFLFLSYTLLTLIQSKSAMLIALAGIAVGTGLLKPNISSLLGNEYPVDSPKRESGFTVFYMGITTGIILGTTLPSYLNAYFGWSVTFASAAFGMIIAFAVFAFGIKRYRIEDYHPFEYHPVKIMNALGMMFLLWLLSFCILWYPRFADIAFLGVVVLSLAYLLTTVKRESPQQGRQTLVIGLLCIVSVMFWAFYFQMFMSLTLFIARVVEPTFLGIQFPPPYYVSIQSIGMLVFGYFLARSKPQLNSVQSGKRTGNKFLLAMLFMWLAYGLITFVSRESTSQALLSPLYFIPAYLMISIAELLLSPVGLSAITVLASRRKVSTMMGIFFVSLGIGGYLSGKLAILTAINPGIRSVIELKTHYATSFTHLLLILTAATLACFMINLLIKHLLSRNNHEK
ncbi:POT family transporter protein proton/peptide symporter [Legionella rubrilucens]|uniref:POT family transporter protein proton/peptide symporter n=1 Tax=Legionella rubrilucens TaxID=458 RepID=A0A0W0XYK1_9GAMM|nr:peptide MFS transporter [Legionella rubrilucens]KTD49347.1 POT family transporter protein proton/peptide symporter [Legionella rubrilucens]